MCVTNPPQPCATFCTGYLIASNTDLQTTAIVYLQAILLLHQTLYETFFPHKRQPLAVYRKLRLQNHVRVQAVLRRAERYTAPLHPTAMCTFTQLYQKRNTVCNHRAVIYPQTAWLLSCSSYAFRHQRVDLTGLVQKQPQKYTNNVT
jgi:hypothetical protein